VQSRDRGQQLAFQTIFRNESVDQAQGLLRNIRCSGEQDNWRLRPESSYFDGNLLPVHFGHKVVNNYNVNRVERGQFQSLATTRSGQNGIPEALKERSLAFEHVLVVVNAEKYPSFEARIRRWGHGSPSTTSIFNTWTQETVQNRSKQKLFCTTVCRSPSFTSCGLAVE
jgi:hypothetical protein